MIFVCQLLTFCHLILHLFKKSFIFFYFKAFLKNLHLLFSSQFEKNQVGKLLDLDKINYEVVPEPILDFQKFKMLKSKLSKEECFYKLIGKKKDS